VGVTIKDVAVHAGVSHKTVSNVIYGRHERVSPETEARVRASLAALNYIPNMAARYLRKQSLGVIALAIPDIINPYFSALSIATVDAAAKYGYTVLIDHTAGKRESEALVLNGLRPQVIDGILLNPLFLEQEDISPQRIDMPVVLLGERLIDAPFDHVMVDDIAAARVVTQHLLSQGRRRIAVIGVPDDPDDIMPRHRLSGYKQALSEANVPIHPELIAPIPPRSFHRTDGARIMHQLLALDQPPDAVFCFNDLVALGAMKALHEAGRSIPEDVAIAGFDNIEEGLFALPSLTTVGADVQEIGRTAVELLIERIRGEKTISPRHVQVPFQLIQRASTIGQAFTFTLPG